MFIFANTSKNVSNKQRRFFGIRNWNLGKICSFCHNLVYMSFQSNYFWLVLLLTNEIATIFISFPECKCRLTTRVQNVIEGTVCLQGTALLISLKDKLSCFILIACFIPHVKASGPVRVIVRGRAGRNSAQENCPLKRCMELCKEKEMLHKAESSLSTIRRVLEALPSLY